MAVFTYVLSDKRRVPSILPLFPANRRQLAAEVLGEVRDVLSGFARGQILVALFTTAGFLVGFSLVGVPHALVAALIGGVFSIIPNGQASGWLVAILLSALERDPAASFDWLSIVVLPTSVYAVTQSLETFVVTPLVQGSRTRLHPLAVLGALIAGGAVGGLAGVFLAIPAAACGRIIIARILLPAMRTRADAARGVE